MAQAVHDRETAIARRITPPLGSTDAPFVFATCRRLLYLAGPIGK
jgi:hypothetical protein